MDLIERPEDLGRRHPWEVARARFFLGLIERLDLAEVTESCLDVGAGDAWFAQQLRTVLSPATRLACWDVHYPTDPAPEAAEAMPGIEFSATQPTGHFDGMLMLDVIEHVEDDVAFVRDVVAGSLAPDGWVLVSVPAYQSLFCAHDRALKHFRRYSPAAIRRVLEASGLSIVARGGLFHGLLPLRGLQVIRERYRPPDTPPTGVGAWKGGERLTKALTVALDAETRMSLALGTRHLPVLPGLSTWALCRPSGREGR
ncbi:MAG TPA: class I SAM-dependent methyltransferase [Acidimicrobiales bacterium]|nr:class I SAM-dependent methyltransferase [Acidimicrobiales bacterium]